MQFRFDMFYRLIRVELIKTITLWQVWVMLFIPTLLALHNFLSNYQAETFKDLYYTIYGDMNLWNHFFFRTLLPLYLILFYPLCMVAFTGYLADMEHRARTWKYLFTLPVSKVEIFAAKIILLFLYTLASLLLCYLVFVGSAYLLLFIRPDLGLDTHNPELLWLLLFFFKVYLSMLGIITLHFWTGLFFKNNLFINIFLIIPLLSIPYSPYLYLFNVSSVHHDVLNKILKEKREYFSMGDMEIFEFGELYSLCLAVVVSIAAYWLLKILKPLQ